MSDMRTLILLPGLLCDEALWAHQMTFLDEVVDVQVARSEEHTSELQSHHDLVCRLLLEKKKQKQKKKKTKCADRHQCNARST